MLITDVVVSVSRPDPPLKEWDWWGERHYHEQVQIVGDLWIGPLEDLAEAVMDACTARGENVMIPIRQFGSGYALYRKNAPSEPRIVWDSNTRLYTCMALSRLIRPTSIGFEYAARVIQEETRREIIPAYNYLGKTTHIVDTAQDWLRACDVVELGELISVFDPKSLPNRVTRAMWHYEYAAQTYWMDVKWTLLATALESLVHTDRYHSTRQFVGRLTSLSHMLPSQQVLPGDLAAIYDLRSTLTHGNSLKQGVTPEIVRLYGLMDSLLRTVLVTAIRDATFRALFASDDSVRNGIAIAP